MANKGQINPTVLYPSDLFQASRNGVLFWVRGIDIQNAFGGGGSSGAGSDEIIDLGDRLVGNELMDIGNRV